MRTLQWIDRHLEKWFLIATLIAMVLIVFMQIVLRWVGRATVWAEETARYIMLYQVWVGASFAIRENAHIRITALVGRLTGRKRSGMELFVLLLFLVFAVWLTGEGCVLVHKIRIMGQVSSGMRLPMTVPYASVPIGGALMTVRLVQKLAQTWFRSRGGGDAPAQREEEMA